MLRTRACIFAASSAAGIPFPDTSANANSVRLGRKLDDVEVVATHLTQGLVKRLHLVARQSFQLPRLERLLDLPCGYLVGFKVCLANKFRSQHSILDVVTGVIKQEHQQRS